MTPSRLRRTVPFVLVSAGLAALAWLGAAAPSGGQAQPRDLAADYTQQVRPLLQKYCLACHSTKVHKGDIDLERFTGLAAIRKDLHPWEQVADQLEIGEMPPRGKPQPSAQERKVLVGWVRAVLDAEARALAGDPGPAVLRRLNNAEYTNTLRDLTGVELQPAREFPADSAAGEGFTNTAATLTMSPALIDRYFKAARDVAAHAVLLPDGFRFSPSAGRRDWSNEALATVRQAYAAYPTDGKLPLLPYVQATLKHRDALKAGTVKLEAVAATEKLSPKYLHALWNALNDPARSHPLDLIRARWQKAKPKDAPALVAEVAHWQAILWETGRIGSYTRGDRTRPRDSLTRQMPSDPPARETAPLRLALKPAPGQAEVLLTLAARELVSPDAKGQILWQRPRFEAKNQPTRLLRDYASFGPAYEIDTAAFFKDAAKYLAAVTDFAHDRKRTLADLARQHALDPARLKNWIALVALEPAKKAGDPPPPLKFLPAAP